MVRMKWSLVVCLFAVGAFSMTFLPSAQAGEDGGAVFVMTNAASGNQINAYTRNEDGTLQSAGAFSTGGNGSGGAIDPLHSQGSLVLTSDHHLLFAVNAASGTVSSFAVHGSDLKLVDTEPSGGSSPTALAQVGNLLYVLNSGGNGNVTGFHVGHDGSLSQIKTSTRSLSGTATSPTSLAFSPNGLFLVVTESATNNIDVFRVRESGELSTITVNPSSGSVPFAAIFSREGVLIVGNASNDTSSYELQWNGTLSVVSSQIPTLGMATCWDVIAGEGRYVFTSNAGSSTVSGFAIGRTGSLTAIDETVVGTNPSGSTNLDIAASADGKFIYTLNSGAGAIGVFSVDRDGSLKAVTQVGGLPASAGLNGIAAY
jgi:6-phosphogluconolactonase